MMKLKIVAETVQNQRENHSPSKYTQSTVQLYEKHSHPAFKDDTQGYDFPDWDSWKRMYRFTPRKVNRSNLTIPITPNSLRESLLHSMHE